MKLPGILIKQKPTSQSHGVHFSQAATVLLDPLALTVLDTRHSYIAPNNEERWFTLDTSSDGKLLALAHTLQQHEPQKAYIRIISARKAVLWTFIFKSDKI